MIYNFLQEICDYFGRYDVQFEGRHEDVTTYLNNRRIFLEEEINMLEEYNQLKEYLKKSYLRRRKLPSC